ncbi:MAG: YtxH domain-containing protein [Gemmatimonadota bacterium]|nr:MAG: YtxH domain-containing protein [Gemmatimonadota bacterium]
MRRRDEELELVEEDLEDEELDDEELDDEDAEDYDLYHSMIGLRGFALGLVVGGLVGAGVALLMAPERGEVVRKRITKGIRDIHEDARDQLEDWSGDARREVGRQRRRLRRRLRRVRR